MSENFQDADRFGCEGCPGNPENREYMQQRGVSVSGVDGRPKGNPVLEAIDDAVQPENGEITTEQHNEMLDDIRAAYLHQLGVGSILGRPKSNPVLEAIDTAKWSFNDIQQAKQETTRALGVMLESANTQIEAIRAAYLRQRSVGSSYGRPKDSPVLEAIELAMLQPKGNKWYRKSGREEFCPSYANEALMKVKESYLQSHPQGADVAGITTNYYACRNCGEPIDMTGAGLEGLSAPGDGGEFEQALKNVVENWYRGQGLDKIVNPLQAAHNTDRAADKQRIAELEQLTEVLKGFLEQQTQRSDNASFAVRRLKTIAKERIAEAKKRVAELEAQIDGMKAMAGVYGKVMSRINKSCEAAGCRQGEDMADFIAGLGARIAELESQLTLALKQRDCESERSSNRMDEIVELRDQLASKGGAK